MDINLISHVYAFVSVPKVYSENTVALLMAPTGKLSNGDKYIDVKFHHVNDMVKKGILQVYFVPSRRKIVSFRTKPVEKETLYSVWPSMANQIKVI